MRGTLTSARVRDLLGIGSRVLRVKFHSPSNQGDNRHAPANTPGIRHVAFAIEDIDADDQPPVGYTTDEQG
jgi:hypothetical protein